MQDEELKVLLISPLPPPIGGIATWTEQYIEWAQKNHIDVDVVNTALLGRRFEKINSKTRIFDETIRTLKIIIDLKIKIKTYMPNVIHLNTPCSKMGIIRDYICAKVAKKKNIKLFVHYRCNIEDQIGNKKIQKYILKKLAQTADTNLVLNNFSKKYLLLTANKESIIIANFIDNSFILPRAKVVRDQVRTISFVGHIQRAKGFLEILDVATKFPDIIFKLAGPVSYEIEKEDRPSNIILIGSVNKQKVKELLIESDIFLFPSYSEGFANAMLEAMACGVPIITTPVGANIEMIGSSGGIIVEVGDTKGIINAINYLKNPELRLRMSNWSTNKVKSEYITEKIMVKLISLYQDLVEKT